MSSGIEILEDQVLGGKSCLTFFKKKTALTWSLLDWWRELRELKKIHVVEQSSFVAKNKGELNTTTTFLSIIGISLNQCQGITFTF